MRRAFSLVELLIVAGLISLLASVLLPVLQSARQRAMQVRCQAQLREIGRAWHMYAAEARGRAMPLAEVSAAQPHDAPGLRYWWGVSDAAGVDHTRGYLWPYLRSELARGGLYECPAQPWGSYVPQGAARSITSTYGYNGYFLAPASAPGWSLQIGHRPWQNVDALRWPQRLLTFADTALQLSDDGPPGNTALLDPPYLYQSGRWARNDFPTTSFRHAGRSVYIAADGHAAANGRSGGLWTAPHLRIGSIGAANDPHYVPDWREWRPGRG